MPLPKTSGTGFIISDIDMKFMPNGQAVANFAVACNDSKKEGDEWVKVREIVYRATAWGKIAEFIADNYSKLTNIEFEGTAFVQTYQKDGEDKQSNNLTVYKVGAPREQSNSGGNGGGWDV